MEETFQQLVPIANHQHLVATLFCKLWDCAYAINPESPSLSLRLKARKVCLNVGPALVFRTEKPHPQQFYFGLSFDPSALEIAVVDRLYELSGAEPFRFKNKLFGAVYLGYVSRDIEEVQEIAMPGVLVFVSRAAEQKNTHPASHNQKLLEFLRRTALSNETHQKGQQRRAVQNRFLACLLGGAVGDALGAPVEGMKRSQILRRFGPKGITNYAPAFSGVGKITA